MQYYTGNILDVQEGYIVHQCNCQTTSSKGLANQIFTRFPYANIYKNNKNRIPGTIKITYNVIGLFAQNSPSKPNNFETKQQRLQWFIECLQKLQHINYDNLEYKSNILNFPYKIGCGLAGGDWDSYHNILQQFQIDNPNLVIRVIKMSE